MFHEGKPYYSGEEHAFREAFTGVPTTTPKARTAGVRNAPPVAPSVRPKRQAQVREVRFAEPKARAQPRGDLWADQGDPSLDWLNGGPEGLPGDGLELAALRGRAEA